MLINHSWVLTKLSRSSKPLGCEGVFKKKLKADGSIDKYKACFVTPPLTNAGCAN